MRLTDAQVLEQLADVGHWSILEGKLTRRWTFTDFAAAKAFVDKLSAVAEAQNHHPDVQFGWGYVELSLFSHDVGALTARDVRLVQAIEEL